MVDEFLEENGVDDSFPNIQVARKEHKVQAPMNLKSYLGPSNYLQESQDSQESQPRPYQEQQARPH